MPYWEEAGPALPLQPLSALRAKGSGGFWLSDGQLRRHLGVRWAATCTPLDMGLLDVGEPLTGCPGKGNG